MLHLWHISTIQARLTASVNVVIEAVLLATWDVIGGDVSTGLAAVYLKRKQISIHGIYKVYNNIGDSIDYYP